MKLVYNWKDSWKWVSVHAMVLAGSLQGAWLYVPEDMKASLPASFVGGVTACILVAGVLGRLVDQTKPDA